MKTRDKLADKELETFFSEMKENDQQIQHPPLPKIKKTENWKLIPIGIAASILLVMWFLNLNKPDYRLDQDIIIISLDRGENQELQFLIETTTLMDSWEAPSSSLLTEF